jgi:enamine deaminase RidA (YjgF/YER057c/UK114 family)
VRKQVVHTDKVPPAARTRFECARLIRDARVEIEAVALAG